MIDEQESINMAIEYQIECDAGTVFQYLTDRDFLVERIEALGEDPPTVKVSRKGKSVEIKLQRVRHLKLPAVAARIVGDDQRFEMIERWRADGDGWTGDYTLDVVGVPARIEAEFELRPAADGCVYSISHSPRVNVPLVGKKLEAILRRETEQGCDAEIDYLVAAIA
ncbi:DUF2505 domain-containing protein [Seongchinamella sediminis]|uniref:DUF2505 domain-containing protein n=1 Tax=Seongchinamella sediminis TaxID=2283635 RepID=UPI001058B6F1|nr:DUF2505 domain-containing protein [Seongchinamella sediminis]